MDSIRLSNYFIGQLVEFVKDVEQTDQVMVPTGTKGIITDIFYKNGKQDGELLSTWPFTVAVNGEDYPSLIPTDLDEVRIIPLTATS
jgi:hypothetical protein